MLNFNVFLVGNVNIQNYLKLWENHQAVKSWCDIYRNLSIPRIEKMRWYRIPRALNVIKRSSSAFTKTKNNYANCNDKFADDKITWLRQLFGISLIYAHSNRRRGARSALPLPSFRTVLVVSSYRTFGIRTLNATYIQIM